MLRRSLRSIPLEIAQLGRRDAGNCTTARVNAFLGPGPANAQTRGVCTLAGPRKADVLAISIPRTELHTIQHFPERMSYGLFVPEVPSG